MTPPRPDLESRYRRYLARCNAHDFDALGAFVATDVSGSRDGLAAYIAGLQNVIAAFPDYRWELQHLLVDGPWLAARLLGTGTHRAPFEGAPATGRVVHTQELVIYRIDDAGLIADCWGDLGTVLWEQISRD